MKHADPIYLDYNATTPIDPAVADAMRPYLEEGFGNPSSTHAQGRRAREAVDRARAQVARGLGASPAEIVFTSGGTESNNHAIKGVAYAHRARGRHLVTSAIEHPAVSEVMDWLEREGWSVTRVGVDAAGRVDPAAVASALTPETVLVSIMLANNEVGTVQPIREIARLARRAGALVHTDAAQAVGKIAVDIEDLGVDLLTVAGHKLYAPKGVGALYVRAGTTLDKWMHGADHEANRRAGTENVLEIVGLGRAVALATDELGARVEHMKTLRDRLESGLREAVSDLRVHGHPTERLPNTLSVAFPGAVAQDVLARLDDVAASAGAACHTDEVHVSATLAAMGVPEEVAIGTIRFSTGRFLTAAQLDLAIRSVVRAIRRR